jgi:hypothetical protein
MSAHPARRKTKADGRVPAGLKAMVVVLHPMGVVNEQWSAGRA